MKKITDHKYIIIVSLVSLLLAPFTGPLVRETVNEITGRGIILKTDEHNIPLVDYGTKMGESIGVHYNAALVSQRAFQEFELIRLNPRHKINGFWKCVHRLHQMIIENSEFAHIPHSYNYPEYKVKKGWESGMTQAQVMQVFLRAFYLKKDSTYLDKCEALLNRFEYPIEEGGFTIKIDSTHWWYEEYADNNRNSSPRVLNGMMYALVGLHEYGTEQKSEKAMFYYQNGMNALLDALDQYDMEGGSYYDNRQKPADKKYHQVHLDLLMILNNIEDHPKLETYIQKWGIIETKEPLSSKIFNLSNLAAFILIALLGRFVIYIIERDKRDPY